MFQVRFGLNIRNNVFSKSIVKQWNRMPGGVVETPSLEVLGDMV